MSSYLEILVAAVLLLELWRGQAAPALHCGAYYAVAGHQQQLQSQQVLVQSELLALVHCNLHRV